MSTELGATLHLAAPPVSITQAQSLAAEYFGVRGTVEPLGGERDRNFRVQESDGRAWVLKIANPAEPPGLGQLQTAALLHIAKTDPSLPVPRIRFPLHGTTSAVNWQPPSRSDGATDPTALGCQVRMCSYLTGTLLQHVPPSSDLRGRIGGQLARLDLALDGFRHPAAQHDLLWDASKAYRVADLLDPDDLRGRELLDHFGRHAANLLPQVRHQVIHNDANPQNIVADGTGEFITGIIDFGDIIRAPLVQEVATACAYQLVDGAGPLDAAGDIVGGYHRINPLTDTEIDVLFDLIVARLILIMAITGRRATQHPDNRDYILRNHHRAASGLERITTIGCAATGAELNRTLRSTS